MFGEITFARMTSRIKARLGTRARGGKFLSDIFTVAGGTIVAQVVAVGATPVLSRLYTPQQMGVFAVYSTVIALFLAFCSGRYELALLLPEDESTAEHLLVLSLLLPIVWCILALPLIPLYRQEFEAIYGAPLTFWRLLVILLALFAVAPYQSATSWHLRGRGFRIVVAAKLAKSGFLSGTQIGCGILNPAPAGLIAGDVAGRLAGSFFLLRSVPFVRIFRQIRLAKLRASAHRYRRFFYLTSTADILNTAGLQIPPLLLERYYGLAVMGLFALGCRLVQGSAALITQSVAQVYLPEAAELARTDPKGMQSLFFQTAIYLLLVAVPILLVLAFAGPYIFGFVLGAKWYDSGVYVRLFVPALIADFIASPLSQTLNILEQQSLKIIWDVWRILTACAAILIPGHAGASADTTILIFSIMTFVSYSLLFLLCYWAIKRNISTRGALSTAV